MQILMNSTFSCDRRWIFCNPKRPIKIINIRIPVGECVYSVVDRKGCKRIREKIVDCTAVKMVQEAAVRFASRMDH